MSSSEKEEFDTYVQRIFLQDAPRSRSAVTSEAYGKRIISYLKGNSEDDKHSPGCLTFQKPAFKTR